MDFGLAKAVRCAKNGSCSRDRAHLELGTLALKAGRKAVARQELIAAVSLCESDNDPIAVEEAKMLLKKMLLK